MLESIRNISNPLLRSISSGIFVGALVTIPTAAILQTAAPKSESSYRYILYASLGGVVAGSLGGLFAGGVKNISDKKSDVTRDRQIWKDWRRFIVRRKVKESDSITSFYLEPEDKESIPNFIPGQFLTIQLDIPEQNKPVIRTYSLSDYPESTTYYRLSIKREPAPPETDAPYGVASNFMHDHIEEGSVILAKPPAGKFVLDVKNARPAVLISNGVGITPMISMAKAVALSNPHRHVWFLHGARDGSLHSFRDEVNAIAHPNLHIIYCYSRPTASDKGNYHRKGYVDVALIKEVVAPEMQRHCDSTDAEYFLCGSPSFMDSLMSELKEWGVPDRQVLFESFIKPKKFEVAQVAPQDQNFISMEIHFSKSGKTLNWTPNDGTILEFAEANNIFPDHSCRVGVCGTCMCKISEGEIEYEDSPSASIDNGSVLICISKPKTAKVVLDI